MATTATAPSAPPAVASPRPNWVVGPFADALFIIGAPILAFLIFWPIFGMFGVGTVLLIFGGANLGHHMPTFIRAYGDKNLMARFRWNMLLAPIIPFTLSMVVIGYLITHGYDIHGVLLLTLILSIWDPWHFFMQNYGFMRIYDRHNAAPRKLAGRMDFWIVATWFIYIMLGAINWLPNLLQAIHRDIGIPILVFLNSQIYQIAQVVSLVAAIGMSIVYAGYLWWCSRKGYYVSPNKLIFLAILNVMMYLTYVPNPVMQSLVPGWTFEAGFATLGVVHVTQYMAIVWKYNRSLAQRGTDVREGLFQRAFSRGGMTVLAIYIALCLGYGYGLLQLTKVGETSKSVWVQDRTHQSDSATAEAQKTETWKLWFVGVVYSVLFTSTLTHYYFDGFIWKVRHKENRQNLAMQEEGSRNAKPAEAPSWWDAHGATGPAKMLLRQALYFGLPIALVMWGGKIIKEDPVKDPMAVISHSEKFEQLMATAQQKAQLGQTAEAQRNHELAMAEIRAAIAACDNLLAIEQQMVAIRPTPSDYCLMADLVYRKSNYYRVAVGPTEGRTPRELLEGHRAQVEQAMDYFKKALALPNEMGGFSHLHKGDLTRAGAEKYVRDMRTELENIDRQLAAAKSSSRT